MADEQSHFRETDYVNRIITQTGTSRNTIDRFRKLLFICWAIDLSEPVGTIPWWWQLLKGFHELGCQATVVPYFGRTQRSSLWETYENPAFLEGKIAYHAFRSLENLPRLKTMARRGRQSIARRFANSITTKKWNRLISKIMLENPQLDAVIVANVPMNHLRGIPSKIKRAMGIPVVYYDVDAPASLPSHSGSEAVNLGGYDPADISEYDLVILQSEGSLRQLVQMGASRVCTVHLGVDPGQFYPLKCHKELDLFYYGMGPKGREKWVNRMIVNPSRKLPLKFGYAGGFGNWSWSGYDMGNAQYLGSSSLKAFKELSSMSKVNLNITRRAHLESFASSSSRPFELASMGCCIVTHPYPGLEKWFEPENEIVIVDSEKEINEAYQRLAGGDDSERQRIGKNARERIIKDHTHLHRAAQILAEISRIGA